MAKRIAIIGASGIGKHHANWWRLAGAEVCAFAGTSEESVARTSETLRASAGFSGRGYADVAAMLREERPDIVDVCSPPPCHGAHVRAALDAGCHVLCEKPFVYDPDQTLETAMAEARALLDLAGEKGLRLEICTQYIVAAQLFRAHFETQRPGEALRRFEGRLEAPAKDRGPDPLRIWADLSPHLFSMLQYFFPGARLDWYSLETHFDGYDAEASFDLRPPDHPPVRCAFHTHNRSEAPSNIRQFTLNDYAFEVQAARDDAGVFCAEIHTPDGITRTGDFMRQLICGFLEDGPPQPRAAILANLHWMIEMGARGMAPRRLFREDHPQPCLE
jgi:predicted dehydrogenase